ncbi:Mbeg1-like protein [Salegentibacter sp. T436]|uniref:Mbeg1-like protein n=1 Tax=Salegentibacter sp. T436 TaxID=1729720 RepID=UPI00094A93D8|nr:Mbeg1-like protein [Salegentibacter sp. T436]APS38173.1 hypothetical protein AO058_04400 [Salegentibacter sp. T436]
MKPTLMILVVLLLGCVTPKEILTGCDHYSGWCNEIRDLAVQSWKYAQLSKNVYEQEYQFKVSDLFKRIESFENKAIDFNAALYQDLESEGYVLVFRGTDSTLDYRRGNNPFNQEQNSYALEIFDDLRKKYGAEKLTVAGHSLGGGIATHVSLNRGNVTSYSFNGSPVFKKNGDFENERYSIVENGEILKLFRAPGREPTQLYTSIGCSHGNPVSKHGIQKLATCLTQIAAIESEEVRKSLDLNKLEFEYPKNNSSFMTACKPTINS